MRESLVNRWEAVPARPVRLLLVNPRFPESFWSFRWALQALLPGKRAVNPPLGLATLAALVPPHWQVTIRDENIEPLPFEPQVDIVGVCGMAVQYERQRALLEHYRGRGCFVVAGGSYASLQPEAYAGCADAVVAGEAEHIWPEFCRDFEAGRARPEYRETGVVELEQSPTPRFDLLKLEHYTTASIQFSRGCPYRCEFCDIPLLFGRRPRTKTLGQIGRELEALRKAGAANVFFVDDNLIGHQPRAKALLDYLGEYQKRHGYPFSLGTEASVNLAGDPELLRRFREAGFRWVFLGIETPDADSLAEVGKKQNLKSDLLEAVRNFYRSGIDVFSGFIVGFDHDRPASFQRLYRFIVRSGIQVAMLGLLTAVPRTALYKRLEREGRLRRDVAPGDNTGGKTNVLPLNMTYEEMTAGYTRLYQRLCSDRAISVRVRAKLQHFGRTHAPSRRDWSESLRLAARLLRRGILEGGIRRAAAFLWSLASSRPGLWPVAMHDWAHALAIRDYALRHLEPAEGRERDRLHGTVQKLAARLRRRLPPHSLDLAPEAGGRRLRLVVRRHLAGSEARAAARLLRRLLERAPAVTIAVGFREGAVQDRFGLRELLLPLRRYADRIVVESDCSLLPWLDSSVFRIVAAGR